MLSLETSKLKCGSNGSFKYYVEKYGEKEESGEGGGRDREYSWGKYDVLDLFMT